MAGQPGTAVRCDGFSLQVFHELVHQDKMEHQGQAVNFGLGQTISIAVRRNYLYEDAFEKLSPDNGMLAVIVAVLGSDHIV